MKSKWYISDRDNFSQPHQAVVETKTGKVLCVCYGVEAEKNAKKIIKALEKK